MKKIAEKRKPPSRVRYEQGHPTVSCRISRELYDRLQKLKDSEGKSFADILKIGLGVVELQATNEAELKKQGYTKGYKKGYADAESVFRITYPCNVCGKTMIVAGDVAKETIRGYIRDNYWGHTECHTWRIA